MSHVCLSFCLLRVLPPSHLLFWLEELLAFLSPVSGRLLYFDFVN